uniref:Small ribosomal subunit protein uS19m n=1 Tax=Ophioglossum californicum TaxID=1267209 RepID=A0A1B3TRE2_9MONI|nr:ribosomal protein S19 [Ophioglossum californicum]YP_010439829.1 ribosomal protein S19 [Ophioglossum vulgatum]AOH05882.1 ribosomal protein S19 [Ophioglossum californicum]UTD44875.1 ribosomal protein S19 [Ophioglossum vulgatum]
MARSVWKGPFFEAKMSKNNKRIKWKIWSRRSSILPEFVGCYAQIYTGKVFVRSRITNEKVGHKFGEFASTRKTSKTTRALR